jgi:hypothetical protein
MSDPVIPSSILPEELKQVQDVQAQFSSLTRRYGELHFQKKFIDEEMVNIDEEMLNLETRRVEIMTNLQNKYGTGTIDVANGTFIPAVSPTTLPVS